MNSGIFGFPSRTGLAASNIISITEFDASGSYSIPLNAATLEILLIGGGGGGAGGSNSNNNNASGGGGGAGGSIVYVDCLVIEDLPSTTLNVSIGIGGLGGSSGLANNGVAVRQTTSGQPGGNSLISMAGTPGLLLKAQGGEGGSAASVLVAPSAAGTSRGGAGRVSNLKFITATNDSGGAGGLNTTTPITPIVVYHARNNAGAAGGSSPSAAVPAITGGSIEIASNSTPTINSIITHVNLSLVGQTAGITAAYGGRINAGPTLGAGQNGTQMIGSSLKSFGGGIGGAGGGASSNNAGGGNGGDGYRGGGGGGGGASRSNNVPGGTGGRGGNGYCCIVARA